MDAEIKRKWVKALRSGKYERGMHHLHNHGRYCCLGVLCKITTGIMGYDFSEHFSAGVGRTLAAMNDTRGASFAEIADYIEVNL